MTPTSFFDRFNGRLVAFLQEVLQELIQSLSSTSLPHNVLKTFKVILMLSKDTISPAKKGTTVKSQQSRSLFICLWELTRRACYNFRECRLLNKSN
ncbi:MAG TPA: hypothetical protein DCG57_10300 [Candidatus Riflebacteria bacterium]|nr:hypothetical protein [Candidatus Riflebacteria bacterium]